MAFAYLNPQGRIWQANGLNYLLSSQDLSPEKGLCSLQNPDIKALQKGGVAQNLPSSPPRVLSREDGRPGSTLSASPSRQAATQSSAEGGDIYSRAGAGERSETHGTDSRVGSRSHIIPTESWPQIWRQQLRRTGKALFAWSYMALGSDLLSAAQRQEEDPSSPGMAQRKMRSQCLSRLFSDLAHPAGTHTFWPIALPENDDRAYLPNMDCFWSGLEELGCRGVIFLGKKAASAAMGTDELKPLSQLFKFGKLVWILWEPDEIAKNPMVYNTVLPFLKRSLGQFVRI